MYYIYRISVVIALILASVLLNPLLVLIAQIIVLIAQIMLIYYVWLIMGVDNNKYSIVNKLQNLEKFKNIINKIIKFFNVLETCIENKIIDKQFASEMLDATDDDEN